MAACRIKLGAERGLVMALRKLEQRLYEENGELPRELRSVVDDALVDWAVEEVQQEMERQRQMYPYSGEHTAADWAAILMEEVGEVADALDKPEQLHTELIQVAAVAMSWRGDSEEDMRKRLSYSLALRFKKPRLKQSQLAWLKEVMSHAGSVAREVNTPAGEWNFRHDSLLYLATDTAAWACALTVPY